MICSGAFAIPFHSAESSVTIMNSPFLNCETMLTALGAAAA